MSDDDNRWRDDWVWLRPFQLVTAVVVLSILPYIDRATAQVLGAWVLIAPGLALSIVVFGLLRLCKRPYERTSESSNSDPNYAAVAFLSTYLLVATALNCWVVATVWIVTTPKTDAVVPEMKTSNLEDVVKAKDIQTLAGAGGGPIASTPKLSYLDADIMNTLRDVTCAHVPNATNSTFTNEFECRMSSDRTLNRPMCRFIWKVGPMFDSGTDLAIVTNRDDVVSKFTTSGYGRWGLSGGPPSDAPYLGVAFVACAHGSLPSPISEWNLRVAFVLSKLADIKEYNSLFRTVGFDWVTPQYFDRPYIAELFALTSLYRVSGLLFTGNPPLAQTMTSSRHDDLFGVEQLKALRQIALTNVRVGNNSDGQLGNSRGSCLLVASVSGLTDVSGAKVHVAPSAVTPVLSTADRSLVFIPTVSEPISVPCTLVSALVTRDMSSASKYPPALTGTTVRYYLAPGESMRDATRRGFNVRATGLTLYLLGFAVTYDGKRFAQVTGSWPRDEFIAAR